MKRKLLNNIQSSESVTKRRNTTRMILHDIHANVRDKTIKFIDETHTYKVDWENDGSFVSDNIMSVTTFCKTFFPKFNPDEVIKKMMNSKKWHKSKYFGWSTQQIKQHWEEIREIAARNGTAHHLFCEKFYNGLVEDISKVEYNPAIRQFMDFVDDHKQLIPYRTEWVLRSNKEHKICGTPDIIFVNKLTNDKVLYLDIYDWKNSKKISKFGFENGIYPLNNVPNSNYFHYSIQLNIYKYILEKFYSPILYKGKYLDVKVINMFIVVMHEQRKAYSKMLLPCFQEEVEKMFDGRRIQLEKLCK